MTLEALYLQAWIQGLHRAHQPPVRPVSGRAQHVRLDGADRAAYVPLWPAERSR